MAKNCLKMEPKARDVPIIVFMGFRDHLDMKRLLNPLLGPFYDEVAVRKGLEDFIKEIGYAISQFNTNFTRYSLYLRLATITGQYPFRLYTQG